MHNPDSARVEIEDLAQTIGHFVRVRQETVRGSVASSSETLDQSPAGGAGQLVVDDGVGVVPFAYDPAGSPLAHAFENEVGQDAHAF